MKEDHATEQTMFKQIHTTIRRLLGSFRLHAQVASQQTHNNSNNNSNNKINTTTSTMYDERSCLTIIKKVIQHLKEQSDHLIQHLIEHLAKEETKCLPLVRKYLSNDEISTLVGNIMGQRSASVMTKILTLAVDSLPDDEKQDMVKHLKKATVGTFFEKWLSEGGWEEEQQRQMHRLTNHSTSTTTTTSVNNNQNIHNISSPSNGFDQSNQNQVSCSNTGIENNENHNTSSENANCLSLSKRSRDSDQDSDVMDLPPAK